ncbi:MAG TPA: glycosyltransferase family 1 protein [Acidimicrobiales bacterium]|jgi:glycosyltransferase involved in cell wall biosynthesis|nr:glycosyltransferase family 1 protein [Acidimicrobiales bacterium]
MSTRVLLVVEQLRRTVPGGIGRYATGLLAGLSALDGGADVSLLASRPGGPPPDPLARWGLPVVGSRLPGPALTRAWDRGLLRAPSGFEVVHAVSTAAPPVRWGRSSPRPAGGGSSAAHPALVVTVHDMVWRLFPEATTRRGRRWHEAALRRALRRADALVVPSTAAAADLLAAGAREGAVSVLHWGADHLPPPDREGAAALLRRLGVGGGYLLTAGTREPRKNLHRLVAGYTRARPALPEPWPLVVVGPEGWGDVALGMDAAPGSPVPEGVVAAGLVTDEILAALYEGARAFAYVPLAEGYGLPPLEAMTFGVPVVASTGVPSAAPVDGQEAPALRVDPLDVDAIGDALVAVARDDGLRATLTARGRAAVTGKTWREAARWHVDLWEGLS